MAIEPLFERESFQEIVDIDRHLLVYQPVDLDRPRADLQGLGLVGDKLLRAELVEIIVSCRQFLVGQRPVEGIARVLLGWIKPGGRVFTRRCREGRKHTGQQHRARCCSLDQVSSPEKYRLRRSLTFAKLPASSAPD